jgi:prolyl 4-hydroxylase
MIERVTQYANIWTIKKFLSNEECTHLINLARTKLVKSSVVDYATGDGIITDYRSSSAAFFNNGFDDIISSIEDRISSMIKMPIDNSEGIQILKYGSGEEYKQHYDWFDPMFKSSLKSLSRGGQRTFTVSMYLNNVDDGGELLFSKLGIKISPQTGLAILFRNSINGIIDRNMMHASLPVKSGEKWAATKWFREGKYK